MARDLQLESDTQLLPAPWLPEQSWVGWDPQRTARLAGCSRSLARSPRNRSSLPQTSALYFIYLQDLQTLWSFRTPQEIKRLTLGASDLRALPRSCHANL